MPNLGKSIDAGNEVDTAVPELKSDGSAVAPVVIITSVVIGSILPPRVVTELELNSVIPPPDTVEEESEKVISPASAIQAKVSSKPGISEEPMWQASQRGNRSSVAESKINHYTTLIVRFQD